MMDKEQDFSGDRGPARSSARDSLFLLTSIFSSDGVNLGKARVRNLSATGLMADCERAIPAGIDVVLELRGIGEVTGRVAWSREDKIGLAFDREIDPQLARKPVGAGKDRAAMPDYLRSARIRR
jgi:hypothetical protein